MGKIPFDPKSVTAENPDVRRMLAVLESGGSYSSAVPFTGLSRTRRLPMSK